MRRRRFRVKSARLEAHANRREEGRRRAGVGGSPTKLDRRRLGPWSAFAARAAAVEMLIEEGKLAVAETRALSRAVAEDEAGIERGRFRFGARREHAVELMRTVFLRGPLT
jgi:hypothetical protein